ncbi:MAG: phage tail protein [Anaerolineae bacterium]|nr:MAG: phage tail protein [Anaerolineae bacterium]
MPLPLSTAFAVPTNKFLRYDPYMAFNFVVEIEGLLVGGFSEVSGLESEITVEDYQEGGLNEFAHKLPGPVTYPNLVLTHGLTDVDTLWNWYHNVTRGIIRRKNGTIMLLDRQRIPVMWWDFHKAYPVKWVGPKFNASSATEAAVEQIELVHQGITKPAASSLGGLARAGLQLGGVLGP